MKRVILGVVAAALALGATAHAQTTDQERRELRERLRELQQEMRDVQRRLGNQSFDGRLEPLVLSLSGNRGRLGVVVRTERDPEGEVGAVIEAVTPDGPSDEAGLKAGDVVITVNGEQLAQTARRWQTTGDRLIEIARELEIGDTVRVEYERDGQQHQATIVARRVPGSSYSLVSPDARVGMLEGSRDAVISAERMADRVARVAGELNLRRLGDEPGSFVFSFGSRWADMELTALDEELGSYFGTTEGLLVVRAPRDGMLNLKGGDVILRIGGRVPTSPSHATRILRSYEPGDEIRIEIMRNRQRSTVSSTVREDGGGSF
ncbi:MAG TPA: PDZ domain-containing protein [Gemmatimonadales bacterium]